MRQLFSLDYFLSTGQGTEKDFLAHSWHIVQKRIEHLERKDPFSSEHPRYLSKIGKLTKFQQYLGTRDKWNIRPNDAKYFNQVARKSVFVLMFRLEK
ncbi:hypothetical protein [Parapedobacter luteus]|uniref:hypothetical protein n=1 Tax=Parapedobacter luteus TaxID=623280 RepID=UPI001FE30862|nr:hypothetical protein [Parapedobacter luteus]